MKDAAETKKTVRAQRTWGIGAAIVCVAADLAVFGWQVFSGRTTMDEFPLELLRAILIFGGVNLLAFLVSVAYLRIEGLPEPGDDDA